MHILDCDVRTILITWVACAGVRLPIGRRDKLVEVDCAADRSREA